MDQTNDMVKSFIYSASFNMPSLCKYFIEQSPDILTKYGDEALQNAAKYGCLETAKFLLSKGAKFTENRHSSLELAVKSGNIEVVDLFLNKGAVLSKRISKECLYLAIKNYQKDMVQFLFSHGVEISNGNRDDESSLQSAAFRSTPEIVELILSHKPDIYAFGPNNRDALGFARKFKRYDNMNAIISYQAELYDKTRSYSKRKLFLELSIIFIATALIIYYYNNFIM
ncbi:ankyrin repeat protein, putative [Trichomonas vaginalis G3]|uniref:Ankyrin repeat protein, putative n=1 Tax=Trichomonas vaginalis (strain ATCC PRA-98 / G3) TaxID=412133 RepID=A2EEQ4_TRIV3|nr:spectrin binding [Trichomonas vaginalis G3]EAY08860.1 ankyrin repeat protein, putative [Trichomonas vaginalis G3]KAI5489356.1 spectrin binding [Trichomonas vaginalis G3]|eukprot:XP_001321083.1 ankyrin repeat protein [Trichomonas vaginalis G3]